MKKMFLTTACLGLVTLPFTSLIACFDRVDHKKNEQDDQKPVINLKNAYRTALEQVSTTDFQIGQIYSAQQIGVDKVFGQDYSFEVQSYDDLTGQIVVDIHRYKDEANFAPEILKRGVTISGFLKVNPTDFLAKIAENLPDDGYLQTSLPSLKASFFQDLNVVTVDDLGIEQHFNLRQAEHLVKIVDIDDQSGQLEASIRVAFGGQHRDLKIKVGGFLVGNERLREIFERVQKALDQINSRSKTSHSQKLATSFLKNIDAHDFYQRLGIGKLPDLKDLQDYGAKVHFTPGKRTNDQKGQLELTITIKFWLDGNFYQRNKTILVSGFRRETITKEDQDRIKAQQIKDYFEKTFNRTTKSSDKLASDAKWTFESENGDLNTLGLKALPRWLTAYASRIQFGVFDANDRSGTLRLRVKIYVGKTALETLVLIEGFKTSEQVLEEKKRENDAFLNDLLELVTRKWSVSELSDRRPSEFAGRSNLTFKNLGLWQIPEQKSLGTIFALETLEHDDDNGTLKVRITLSRRGQTKSGLITIGGFWANKKHLPALLEWIQENRNVSNMSGKLPSQIGQVGQKVTLEELGLKSIPKNRQRGVKLELEIIKINDHTGTIAIKVTLRHGNKPYVGTLTVEGFLAEKNFLQQLLSWIEKNHAHTKLGDQLPSQVGAVGQSASFAKLGLPNVPDHLKKQVQIQLKLTSVDDEEGRIQVEIKLAWLGEPLTKLIWIGGFKTNQTHLEELKRLIEQRVGMTTLNQKLPSSITKVGEQVSWEKLGLQAVAEQLKLLNTRVDLFVSSLNDKLGTINVRVGLTRGKTQLDQFELTIRGYKSSNTIDGELDKLLDWLEKNASQTDLSDDLASQLFAMGDYVTWEKLGLIDPPEQLIKNVKLSFQVVEINDGMGTVKVKVVAEKDGQKAERIVFIGGFMTADKHLKKLLVYLKKEWNKTLWSDKLPSQVGSKGDVFKPSDLGLTDLPSQWKNVVLKISVNGVNDERGEINVLVKVNAGQSHDRIRLVIGGFKTSGQVNRELLEKENQSFKMFQDWVLKNWSRTSLLDKLASQVVHIGQGIGSDFARKFGVANLAKHLSEWFTKISLEVLSVDDYRGTIEFKAVLWGKISQRPKEFHFTLSGFKTISSKDATELDRLLDWIAQHRALTGSNHQLPSEGGFGRGSLVSFEDLGLPQLPSQSEAWEGVRVELTIRSFDDKRGQLTVLVRLKSDQAEREREITISGYLTLEDLLGKVFDQLTQRLAQAKLNNRLPSQMGVVKQLLRFSDFGLSEPDYESRRGVSYKIIIRGFDDDAGVLILTWELEKNGLSQFREHRLGGLMNRRQYEQKVVHEKVNLIRKLNHAKDNESQIGIKIAKNSAYYETDISKITVDDIANNLREFSIRLPGDLGGVKLTWRSVNPQVSNNLLLADLEISWGQISQKLTFAISGFLTPAGKAIRDFIRRLPNQVSTKWTRKPVLDFNVSQISSAHELGIDLFDTLGIFRVDLVVNKIDDKAGVIRLLVLVSSGGEMQSKKIEIEGFWNDAKRREAQQKILSQMQGLFGEFYFDGQIRGLSEQASRDLVTYDLSAYADFIGDSIFYSVGQNLTWETRLANKSWLLRQWIEDTDQDYKLSFEIVERPDQVYFNGIIRVRPNITLVDQKVYSPSTIVIGGFLPFEHHFQALVKDWGQKLTRHLKTNSKGLIISLLQALDKTEPGLSRVNEFEKLTGLSDVMEGPKIGRHQVVIRNIFWNRYLDPKRYHLSELNFRFLTGLTGPDSDYFNVSKLQTQNLQTPEVIEEKRSFTTPVRGFKTKDDVISVVRKELQKYDSLKWAYPDQNARPHNQSLDYSGMRGPKDFGHFRGVLSEMYGREQMPEFHPSYYRLGKKRELFDKFVKESKSGYVSRFDYQSAADVADWLKIVGKFDQFAPWNKVPIDYNDLWNNSDPATRHLFGNARLYFKFTRYDVGFYNSMFFLVGVEMVPNSPSEAIKPVSPHKIPAPKQNQNQANIYLVDAKEEFQVKLPNHLSDYMAASLERDFLKFRLFTGQVRDKLGARMLECSGECERIEVVAHRSPQDKDWDTKLPPLPGLERNFDPSTTRYFNEQVLKLTNVSYRVGKKDYILRDANTLNNLLIGDRYDGEGNKLLIPEEWIEYVSHLAGLGVSLFFKKVSWEQYPRSAKKDGYAAVARFRPVLIYNAKVQLENQKEPSVESVRQQPIVHIGQKVWEIYYRLI